MSEPRDSGKWVHDHDGHFPVAAAAMGGLWSVSSSVNTRPLPLRRVPTGVDTETEDEHNPLPTSRIAVPQNLAAPSLIPRILPGLFVIFRLLAVVPASAGICVHLYNLYHPPACNANSRVEYSLSILWALLTAHQCLSLATGLLHRWRVYYSLLPTLIRLLALQAICWPATHLTLKLFDHDKRPLVCWAAIGTTTCISKAIEMWVTSNLRLYPKDGRGWSVRGVAVWVVGELGGRGAAGSADVPGGSGLRNDSMGNAKGRRWNWNRVLTKCVAPPCAIYVVMAWALLLKREFEPAVSGC